MGGVQVRATLLQIEVDPAETAADRRRACGRARPRPGGRRSGGAARAVAGRRLRVRRLRGRGRAGRRRPHGRGDGAAARDAGVWLHAGSVVEARPGPDGAALQHLAALRARRRAAAAYRKIHRFGFDRGEAALMAARREIVTAALPQTVLGLATCYDLRFPELFRRLVDAGAQTLVVPAGWPAGGARTGGCSRRPGRSRTRPTSWPAARPGRTPGCRRPGTASSSTRGARSWPRPAPGEEALTVDLDPARVAATRAELPGPAGPRLPARPRAADGPAVAADRPAPRAPTAPCSTRRSTHTATAISSAGSASSRSTSTA